MTEEVHDQAAKDRLDSSWKTHAALHEWTAKVDAKASIVLTLEVAVAALFATLTERGKLLEAATAGLIGVLLTYSGLVLVLLSVLLAGWVVFPRLARKSSANDWQDNVLYFGHLRLWAVNDLTIKLSRLSTEEELGQLARQMIVMSRVCWRKHALLQYSMALAGGGFLLLVIASVFAR